MSATEGIISNEKLFSNSQILSKTVSNTSSLKNGFKNKNMEQKHVIKTNTKSLEEQFKAACETIQNLPKNGPFQPSNEMLLKFYAYYKQATFGPCKSSRPGIFKVVERAKYDAWYSVKDLSKEQAMQGYIDEIKKIIETMPHNDFVQKLINIIGPFYEFVDEKNQVINPSDKQSENEDDENEDGDDQDEEEDTKSVIENKSYVLDKNLPIISSTLTNSYENIDQSMLNSFNSKHTGVNGHANNIIENSKILLKPIQDNSSLVNGHVNGYSSVETKTNGFNHSNFNEITSDDEEDFCDTSDYINEQDLLIQKLKKSQSSSDDFEPFKSRDYNHNNILNKLNENGFSESDSSFNRSNQDHEVKSILSNNKILNSDSDEKSKKFSPIIQKYGGELNSPPGQIPTGSYNQNRYSRPGSSQSMGYATNRFSQAPGQTHSHGSGGGMGGGNSGNENFLVQDTNRQILLILLRLQQDTSNVLTRLSYLESSVLSFQSNRFENGLAINNQAPSAFSVVNASPQQRANRSSSYGFLVDMFKNIDWKTVAIAIIWPFIIRLVFYFLKKVRLVIKFRKAK